MALPLLKKLLDYPADIAGEMCGACMSKTRPLAGNKKGGCAAYAVSRSKSSSAISSFTVTILSTRYAFIPQKIRPLSTSPK